MKRHAPATARNSAAIAKVLAKELPAAGTVLEIASGTGEHAIFMARQFPDLTWLPSDHDAEALAFIREWTAESGIPNIADPIVLDASNAIWNARQTDAIFCCNMIHIAPWDAAQGLFEGAGHLLKDGAPLILYGPFVEPNVETAPSNIVFDQNLKERDPRWGLRSLIEIDDCGAKHGLVRTRRYEMPANNLMLVYHKTVVA